MALLPSKLIHFGWGTPSCVQLRTQAVTMQTIPFDGLVVDLEKNAVPINTATKFAWQVWGNTVVKEEDYSTAMEALALTPMGRFTENFLRFNITPGLNMDWFDPAFDAMYENATVAGRVVRVCKLRGIFFDTEAYNQREIWQYAYQPYAAQHTFEEYQVQVRLCGKQFMQAIQEGYPHTQVILAYGYYLPYRPSGGRVIPLNLSKNGLLPSFIDGMLDVIKPPQLLYDGWESSYGYTDEEQFSKAYDLIHQKHVTWHHPSLQVKFRQHYRSSFGIWLDRGNKWNQTDFSLNYFTPEQFEISLNLALTYADRYVWVYNNSANWWNGSVPQPYIIALQQSKIGV